MTPVTTARCGLELYWVNASDAGPISTTNLDPFDHQAFRIPPGERRVISRSNSADKNSIVNQLSRDICFPFAKVVSRQHAVIEWVDSGPIIKDLGSTHGTFVSRSGAKALPTGGFAVTKPKAPLETVTGVMALHDGDMIQFGKNCGREGVVYEPVRCFVRFVQSSPTQPRSSTAKTHPYAIDDDVLDCESDIVSIDAETFHRSLRNPDAVLSSLSHSTSPEAPSLNLTSDDDNLRLNHLADILFNPKDQAQRRPSIGHTRSSSCSDPEDDSDDSDSAISSVESGEGSESLGPIPVHDDARHLVPLEEKEKDATTSLPQVAAEPPNDPDSAQHKRKLDQTSFDGPTVAGQNDAPPASEVLSSSDDGSSCDDSSSASDVSSSCTSTSSSHSAAKKRRITVSEEPCHQDKVAPSQASRRRKAVRALVGKAIYTTGILTVGFFTGSIFTFKSMLNAAAAANASGSGPQ